MKGFEHIWVNAHGPLRYISADPEFLNKFVKESNYFGIAFNPTSARRRSKLSVLERENAVIRLFVQRLLNDALHAEKRTILVLQQLKSSPFQLPQ